VKKNQNKMRLSPVFMTVVAIAAPFCNSSWSAQAQTTQNSKKTAAVVTPSIPGEQESVIRSEDASTLQATASFQIAAPAAAISQNSSTQTTATSQVNHRQDVFSEASAAKVSSQVIVPMSDVPNPAKAPKNFNQTKNIVSAAATLQTKPASIATSWIAPAVSSAAATLQTKPASIATSWIASTIGQNSNTPPFPETQQTPSQQQNTTPPEQPAAPTTPPETQPNQAPAESEPRVLVSEVVVRSESGQPLSPELEDEVYRAIRTQPGRTTTREQLQQDINAVFATGFFSNVRAVPEDTPLGVRVSFVVQPNPVLNKVQIQANPGTGVTSVLDPKVVDDIFREQYGKILNLRDLQEGIKQLTKRYQERGYVLAQVIGAPQVSENGVVTLQVAEGVVESIRVRFRTKEGQETNEKGEPIRGKTQRYIITRELQLKPGQVFNRNIVQKDLQRVFGLGLFEDVNVSLAPGTDPSKVDVVVNVVERNSGQIAAGAGISSASGLFGTISYQEQNLNGRNQKLGAELQIGQREFLFDIRFTDPWIAGDPYRTSYTINAFRRRTISLIFDGPDKNIQTYNPRKPNEGGDRPRILRLGGGVVFSRPLSKNPYERAEWTASAGLQYQRVSTRDADGNLRKLGRLEDITVPCEQDSSRCLDLTESGKGQDDLLLVQLGLVRDRRDNPLQPTSGSFFRLGVDQSIPVGLGNILLTRFRGSYSQYFPVKFFSFSKGPQTLAFNIQAGTVLGDLPPYEAFTLGGSNSVRGYEEGALGSSRSFAQASIEYRFPVFSVISGALFFDVGTDFGSETKAGQLLDKNGTGYGYGIGVRVQSPLGPIRVDYGINDEGDSRINFGIGERF
jgi:outer membrane protein insertion porin family